MLLLLLQPDANIGGTSMFRILEFSSLSTMCINPAQQYWRLDIWCLKKSPKLANQLHLGTYSLLHCLVVNPWGRPPWCQCSSIGREKFLQHKWSADKVSNWNQLTDSNTVQTLICLIKGSISEYSFQYFCTMAAVSCCFDNIPHLSCQRLHLQGPQPPRPFGQQMQARILTRYPTWSHFSSPQQYA